MAIDWSVSSSLNGLSSILTHPPNSIERIPPPSGEETLSGYATQVGCFDVMGSGTAGNGDGMELRWDWMPLDQFRRLWLAGGGDSAPSAAGYLRRPDPLPSSGGALVWGDYSGIVHRPDPYRDWIGMRQQIILRITRLVRLQASS